MLQSLDKDTQRKVKRKFRKLWRKMIKSDPGLINLFTQKNLGDNPTKAMKRNRSVIVTTSIIRSVRE